MSSSDDIKLPHMPLWVADVQTSEDCDAMTSADFGIYMRLLIRQWIKGTIPADATKIAHLLRESPKVIQAWLDAYPDKMPEIGGGRRANERCTLERAKAVNKVKINRTNGKAGGKRPPNRTPTRPVSENPSELIPNGGTRTSDSLSMCSEGGVGETELEAALNALGEWAGRERGTQGNGRDSLRSDEEEDLRRRLEVMPDVVPWVPEAVLKARGKGDAFNGPKYAMVIVHRLVDEAKKRHAIPAQPSGFRPSMPKLGVANAG